MPERLTRGIRIAVSEADGMEGIRQEDIYPLLRKHFVALFEHRHGAFIRFVCTHPDLGPAFDVNDIEARRHLEFLIANDDCAVRYGVLEPLEIWGIYRPLDQPSPARPERPLAARTPTPPVCGHGRNSHISLLEAGERKMFNVRALYEAATDPEKGSFFEFVIQEAARHYCSRNSTVIDVGANGGAHTMTMAETVGPDGRVVAFEPDQRIFQSHLLPLQQRYPWISLHQVALSDHSGSARFYLDECTALSSLDARNHQPIHTVGETDVAVSTLDEIEALQTTRHLPFMKIDVEGAELRVLKGAKRTIAKYRPLIVLELDWFHVFNANHARYVAGEHERDAQSFFQWLRQLGNGYLALDFFGGPICSYSPHDWNIFLVPEGFEEPHLRKLLLDAGTRFFDEYRSWTLY